MARHLLFFYEGHASCRCEPPKIFQLVFVMNVQKHNKKYNRILAKFSRTWGESEWVLRLPLGGISTERGFLLCGRMSAIAGNHQCKRERKREWEKQTEALRRIERVRLSRACLRISNEILRRNFQHGSKTTTTTTTILHNNPQYEAGAQQQPANVYTLILYYRDILHTYICMYL